MHAMRVFVKLVTIENCLFAIVINLFRSIYSCICLRDFSSYFNSICFSSGSVCNCYKGLSHYIYKTIARNPLVVKQRWNTLIWIFGYYICANKVLNVQQVLLRLNNITAHTPPYSCFIRGVMLNRLSVKPLSTEYPSKSETEKCDVYLITIIDYLLNLQKGKIRIYNNHNVHG